MADADVPPPVLDMARVIAYAFVDSSIEWTGRQALYVGGELLGEVPRLALCQNTSGPFTEILLFHCDDEWQVLGASGGATLEAALDQAERAYRGVSEQWVYTGVTVAEADQGIRTHHPGSVCAFCNRLATDTDGVFFTGNIAVCHGCVRKMYKAMQERSDDDA